MKTDDTNRTTEVTNLARQKDSVEPPLMSYTAVTSKRTMAEAFINELIRFGQRILPEREISIEDVMGICKVALNREDHGITMIEGRHLRARITEQLSRAQRYQESFSLIVLKFDIIESIAAYESIVDTLSERMRRTDLMFLFKSRIILLLPHTDEEACRTLDKRIRCLMDSCLRDISQAVTFNDLTFPGSVFKASQVLDWAEDQLRT